MSDDPQGSAALPRYDENGIPDDPTLPIIPLLEGETTLPDGTIEGR